MALPGVEVVVDGDGAAGAAAIADRDILVEGLGALDRWCIDPLVLPDGVGAAVAADRTLHRACLGEACRVLNHVILDEWVDGPAVDGQCSETTGYAERTAVGNGTVGELAQKNRREAEGDRTGCFLGSIQRRQQSRCRC